MNREHAIRKVGANRTYIFKKPINWKEAIEKAKKRGYFTERERFGSASWMTCAVGCKLHDIAGTKYGANPLDALTSWDNESARTLDRLGREFDQAVANNFISEAERLYKEIIAQNISVRFEE